MAEGYQAGMKASNAKYKIYLHQDVFILNRNFLYDTLQLFLKNPAVGMLGMVGTKKLLECMPIELHTDGMETYRYVYANYFLCRKITQTERTDLLRLISNTLPHMVSSSGQKPQPLRLYTPESTPFLPNIKNMGTVHYLHEMPLVFRHSKINLNITLRSIKNGIPLRAIDIMGAGGFLLTNYQNDFNYHFVEGEDYASFSSPAEMLDKIEYYLCHDTERQKIAENGWKKICSEHTYEVRLQEMLETAHLT